MKSFAYRTKKLFQYVCGGNISTACQIFIFLSFFFFGAVGKMFSNITSVNLPPVNAPTSTLMLTCFKLQIEMMLFSHTSVSTASSAPMCLWAKNPKTPGLFLRQLYWSCRWWKKSPKTQEERNGNRRGVTEQKVVCYIYIYIKKGMIICNQKVEMKNNLLYSPQWCQ